MKKQILAAFLCGLVVPLLLMLLAGRSEPRQGLDTESDGLTQTQASSGDSVDGKTTLVVRSDTGNLRQMALQEYLTGVVLAEMPADFEPEALKAQAVVARTYTCKRIGTPKHESAAVCMDSGCCQGFLDPEDYLAQGGREASVEKIRQAIRDTDGLVLTYEGALIDATYFSCSGGMTEDAVAVWGQDVPYLQSVQSPGEEDAPRYTSELRFTPEEFLDKLGCADSSAPEDWFGDITYTDGGGVDTIVICGEEFTGKELRSLLGLRSTAFSVSASEEAIIFTVKGFGHRVGMSQYGAQAMAEAGSGYAQILEHYYQGTSLEQMEP